jgi:hypothetical protein
MSKELVVVIGLPNSGRTTWITSNYTGPNTVVIDETAYPKLFKEGRYQEVEFFNSIEWVTKQVLDLMEKSTERIVVSVLQPIPYTWLSIVELAKTHEYKFTPVKPINGSLFYKSNQFGNMFDQMDSIKKSTGKRFPRFIKDKKKGPDDDEERENPNLFNNFTNGFLSAYTFFNSNNYRVAGLEPEKWIDLITLNYKAAIIKEQQVKNNRDAKVTKEKAKQEAELAKQEVEKAKQAKLEAKLVEKAKREAEKMTKQEVEELTEVNEINEVTELTDEVKA